MKFIATVIIHKIKNVTRTFNVRHCDVYSCLLLYFDTHLYVSVSSHCCVAEEEARAKRRSEKELKSCGIQSEQQAAAVELEWERKERREPRERRS